MTIYTVCKGRVYPGLACQGLIVERSGFLDLNNGISLYLNTAVQVVNSIIPNQMPLSAVPDLGLHLCLLVCILEIKMVISVIKLYFKPYMPNGFFYLNSLDQSISTKRGVWLIFIITMF